MKIYIAVILTSLLTLGCSTTKDIANVDAVANTHQGLFKDDFGVQTWSFRNYFPSDMIGTLDKLQEMGITKVEGDGGRIPPEEFRKLCEARGIKIPSTGTSLQELEEDPLQVVDKAKKLSLIHI